jgi:prespore-specific regulator
MKTMRQDAWSDEDDLLLAEIILRHIREGSTQLLAFEEAGERLGRTAAACGYRWNACVRKQYAAAIDIAKAQRKEQKSLLNQASQPSRGRLAARNSYELYNVEMDLEQDSDGEYTTTDITWHDVIRFLKQNKNEHQTLLSRIRELERDMEHYEMEATTVRHQYEQLSNEYQKLQDEHQSVTEDYKTLVRIMERARKMTILEPELSNQDATLKEDQSTVKQSVTTTLD